MRGSLEDVWAASLSGSYDDLSFWNIADGAEERASGCN